MRARFVGTSLLSGALPLDVSAGGSADRRAWSVRGTGASAGPPQGLCHRVKTYRAYSTPLRMHVWFGPAIAVPAMWQAVLLGYFPMYTPDGTGASYTEEAVGAA